MWTLTGHHSELKMLLYYTGKVPRNILLRIEAFLELSAKDILYENERSREQYVGYDCKQLMDLLR